MLNDSDRNEAVARFTTVLALMTKELLDVGAPASAMAAALRVRAGAIEAARPRDPGMTLDERELVDLARKGHDFINSLLVAGIEEQVAVCVLGNVLIERVAHVRGAAGAAHWLRNLAVLVDQNGDAIEETARAH